MTIKKILSILLSVCMLMTAFAAFASETNANPKYLFSPVSFTYSGEEANSLLGGETLTATITVQNGGADESLTFALIISKNGKVISAANETKSVSGKHTFGVDATLPDDVTGVEAKAVLWEGYSNMKPIITEALMPSDNADLTYLSVDGVAMEGFSSDKTYYEYFVEDYSRTDVPVIKVKTANSASKVEIANPEWYPGKSVITVTAPDGNKKEYTIKYKVDDAPFVEDIYILDNNTLPSGAPVARQSSYEPFGMKKDALIYNDRPDYTVTDVYGDSFADAGIIMMNMDWVNGLSKIGEECEIFKSGTAYKWVNFKTTRGVTVKVFSDGAAVPTNLTSMGYTKETTDEYFTASGGKYSYNEVYSKHFGAGEIAYVPNVYSKASLCPAVLVYFDPFGTVEGGLNDITINGVSLEGFKSGVYEYTYELSADTLVAPEVVAYPTDERSHVAVTAPTYFPGESVISVTAPGAETVTYKITYTCDSPLADNIVGDPDVTSWQTHNGNTHNNRSELPAIYHNLQVGNTNLVHDRIQANGAAVVVDESLLGRDYISAGHDWHAGSVNGDFDEVYKDASGINPDWYTFDLHRSADVKVVFKTDAFKTTVGDSITDIQIMEGNQLPDGTAIVPSKHYRYIPGGFKEGGQYLPDRTFTLSGITDIDLIGSDIISWAWESYKSGDAVQNYYKANHNVDNTPGIVNWINFTMNRDAEIYVYTSLTKGNQTDNDRALEAAGFTYVSGSGVYAKSSVGIANNTYSGKWVKTVSAGDAVSLPSNRSGGEQGRVVPFAVIKYTSELPELSDDEIEPLNNSFITAYFREQGYSFSKKDSGYFIQAFTACGLANCNGMFSRHYEVSNGETVTVSMPSFINREFFVVLDYDGIEGEDFDNGVVIEDEEPLNLVNFENDFNQSEAKIAAYSISDADGTLTIDIEAEKGSTLGFALLRPDKTYQTKYTGKQIAEDMAVLTQLTLDENGVFSYVIDMADEDSGYYIPVLNGVVQDGKIFFATSEDRAKMYKEIKKILDGEELSEGETIQTALVKKLDSDNQESLAINTLAVINEKLSTINETTYAKAIIALYNEDNEAVKDADTMKELFTDAAFIALVDEGKADIENVMVSAGIEEKYADLYYDEISEDTKKVFGKNNFEGKGFYTREAISEAFNEAVILAFVADMNAQSDAEKLIMEFGEDIGIDVDEYKDLTTKQKNKVKDYVVGLGKVASTETLAKKINDKIDDVSKESSGGGRGGSSGGGSSSGGAGYFGSTTPIEATPEVKEPVFEGFDDMEGFDWAKDSVNALAKDGIVSGIGDGKFAPGNDVTREEILTMLLRAYKVDVSGAKCSFKDVPADAWYAPYVAKGFELGVTMGIDAENFGSKKAVTRAEVAAMAYRIATHFGGEFTPETELFADDASIADWAKTSVYALKGASVINGTGTGTFEPNKGCTRAEAAKIVYGLINR